MKKKKEKSSWLQRLLARASYFFVLTVPELLFANHAAPSVAGGETRIFWWIGALLIIMVAGSAGMVNALRRDTVTSADDLSADDFTIIEEQ